MREPAPHVLGEVEQIRLDVLRGRGELRAQLGTLGRDPDRAGVEVARAHHQAALGDQERGPERDLVGAEQRGRDDVTPGLQAAVDAQPHPAAQALGDEGLLRLGEAELPRHARVLDRGERARARAAVATRDVDDVCGRLHDAGRDEPDTRLRDELDGDGRLRVHLLEVEDELRQVLDRVDVVVGWRRDQADPGLRVAQPRDLGRHLVPGELAALAGLRPLRDLDLELVGAGGVLRRDAEPAGCDLLDPRVALVVEPRGILAAFAGVGAPAEAVEGDRDGLVRLGRQRAVRHAAAREAAQDLLDRLHLLERDRRPAGDELEQVARLERAATVDERGEALVLGGPPRGRRPAAARARPRPPATPRPPRASSRAARRRAGT